MQHLSLVCFFKRFRESKTPENGKRIEAKASTSLSDDNSKLEPPDPISNSEVKRLSADGSVGVPM